MQRKRLAPVLAVAGGAIVLVLALVIALSLGSKTKSSPNTVNLNMTASIGEMLQGIPQHGTVLGNPKAKVTLTEFGDPQCSACASFSSNGLPNLIQNYVRAGKLRIEYQGQTFVDKYVKGSTDSVRLLRTALAGGEQNRLWNFIEIVYDNQGSEDSGYATDSYLKAVCNAIPGLDVNKAFAAASQSNAFAAQINASAARFNAEGFSATPSFLVGLTGQKQEKVSEVDLTARINALSKS
jgi:protein-disulfide isomerase